MSQDTKTLLEWSNKYLFQNYGRAPLCLVRGEGARVWDTDGKEYLDFVGGIAVDALGHSHPKIVGAIREQATALLQVSNLYQIPSQIHLAKLLVDHSFGDRAFFCNSGTEAIEAAIKLARKYAKETRATDVVDIITMRGAFHGRTLGGAVRDAQREVPARLRAAGAGLQVRRRSATSKAVERAVDNRTAAILVEPIQGEGGVNVAPDGYLAGAPPALRRDRRAADLRRDPDGHGPDRAPLGLPALGCRARRHDARQGARERDPDRRDGGAGGVRPRDDRRERTARRSAATRSPRRSAWRPSPRCSRTGSRSAPTGWDAPDRTAARAGGASVPAIREVRGKGLLIGIDLDRARRPGRRRLPRPRPPRPDRGGEDPPHDAPAHRGRERRRPGRRDRRRRAPPSQAMKHFLSIADLSAQDVERALPPRGRVEAADARRARRGRRSPATPWRWSSRSRRSAPASPSRRAWSSSAGASVYLAAAGHRARAARVDRRRRPEPRRAGSTWIVASTFAQATVDELARARRDPGDQRAVRLEHPCQALADFFTLWERGRRPRRLRLAFIGDGNNVCHSLDAPGRAPRDGMVAGRAPRLRARRARRWTTARGVGRAHRRSRTTSRQRRRGADAVYTDVWTSMGQEAERERRLEAFSPLPGERPRDRLRASRRGRDALPARAPRRGDHRRGARRAQSVVFDQAENRLHVQKAVLLRLLGKG